jgi:hypothetical protein
MSDRRKREARQRAAETGQPYVRAARQVSAEHQAQQTRDAIGAAEPAVLPGPVALMLARQLYAARSHLGAASALAQRHGDLFQTATTFGAEQQPTTAVSATHAAARRALYDLGRWAGRTAAASGTVTVEPIPLGDNQAGLQAYAELYPDEGNWCSVPGGQMPRPGHAPAAASTEARISRTDSLPGPIPDTQLTARSEGRSVVRAGDVVPGTPAAPIWDAEHALSAYNGDWMDRTGDSPADLAAALDGLRELQATFHDAIGGVLGELVRRVQAGTLIVDGDQAQELKRTADGADVQMSQLRTTLFRAREATIGAKAALPAPAGVRVSATLSRPFAGKTLGDIRHALGQEVFVQRHRSKTRETDDSRVDALQRILDWMHAHDRTRYDPAEHAATDPAHFGTPA